MRTHPLPPPGLAYVIQDLKVVVLQRTVVSRFGCFVFEVWVLRFRVLRASFSSLGCSVFEFWVLRFRVLGAPFSRFGSRLRASVFVFQCFVFETTVFEPTFYNFYTSHLRSNSTIYHTDLGQNAVFHNFSRQIALSQAQSIFRTINRGL